MLYNKNTHPDPAPMVGGQHTCATAIVSGSAAPAGCQFIESVAMTSACPGGWFEAPH
jgi:hypothetical protein